MRNRKGLTQEALAHGSEIDTRYVGGIERGQENPSVAVLGRIAKTLEVHPAELLLDGPAFRLVASPALSDGAP